MVVQKKKKTCIQLFVLLWKSLSELDLIDASISFNTIHHLNIYINFENPVFIIRVLQSA